MKTDGLSVRGTATLAQFHTFVTLTVHFEVAVRAFAVATKGLRETTAVRSLSSQRSLRPTAFKVK
ncbi:MAG: hypothetical protein PXZ08_09670 [Actinomycetota bacterium]|nr:hypothetical protein [Actinomycetota bacterium]